MSNLKIENLEVKIDGKKVVNGFNLEIKPGEIHVLMGPNGSGKSTLSNALLGQGDYQVLAGKVLLGEVDILSLPTWQRAQAGLFLTMQYPVAVPGISTYEVLENALPDTPIDQIKNSIDIKAKELDLNQALLNRGINVDFSGGEKKRNETLQLDILKPKFALIDEIDSGLDIDSLKTVSENIKNLVKSHETGILLITHYNRILEVLKPDFVHVFSKGTIVKSGGFELAEELEETGYNKYK